MSLSERIPPCPKCGCHSFLIFEDRPAECLRCFTKAEQAEVDRLMRSVVDG